MIAKEQIKARLEEYAKELAPDLESEVKRIESGSETTQFHYGDYMSIIARFSEGNRSVAIIIHRALVLAGANERGANWALRLAI